MKKQNKQWKEPRNGGSSEETEGEENYYLFMEFEIFQLIPFLISTNIKFMKYLKYISCNYMLNYLECDWLRSGAE
jgi:hypothetical protein